MEGLDHAVQARLEAMPNEDFDKVADTCMEQAVVWREQRATRVTDRQAMECEVVRLEGITSKLTGAIEDGQPVGTWLKERQQELDSLRGKLEEPEPVPDRKELADLIKPHGPLVGLGVGDPATVGQVLRKIGVDRIIVAPDGDGWSFKGAGDFAGLRTDGRQPLPPTPPNRSRAAASLGIGCFRRSRRSNRGDSDAVF